MQEKDVREGTAFLKLLRDQESECESVSLAALPELGQQAPQCVENLGTALSLLDRAASCWWGCPGGDHLGQYLLARALHLARAGLRLANLGLYDESLLMARAIGEIANLLLLFLEDRNAFDDWRQANRRERMTRYSPVQVRRALQASRLGRPLIDEERYRLLSEFSSHVTPETRPQAHNPSRRPVGAAFYQEAGLLLALNEIALATSGVCIAGTRIVQLPTEQRDRLLTAGRALAEALGGVTITELERMWEELAVSSDSQGTEST